MTYFQVPPHYSMLHIYVTYRYTYSREPNQWLLTPYPRTHTLYNQ